MKRESWFLTPFLDQIFVLACFLTIVPAIWGIYQISLGRYLYGVLLIFVWSLLFFPLSWFLDRRKIARIFITLPGAAIILILAAWVIFAEQIIGIYSLIPIQNPRLLIITLPYKSLLFAKKQPVIVHRTGCEGLFTYVYGIFKQLMLYDTIL